MEEAAIQQYYKKLPGSFWGITAFFNPSGHTVWHENYQIFRDASKKQGLKLIAVELAFGNNPFEIRKNDAEILIQLRTDKDNIIWQKERLLNIGLGNLPQDCDKVVWLDCDIIFKNSNWIKETSELLEKYHIVQPYSLIVRMLKGVRYVDEKGLNIGKGDGEKIGSFCYWLNEEKDKDINKESAPGFAWACRKELIKASGIYDKSIVGSGDSIMVSVFYKKLNEFYKRISPEALTSDIIQWEKIFSEKMKNSIYYTDGTIFHLWHGYQKNRRYSSRNGILKKYDFDPDKDIKKDENGIWVWSSGKPGLHDELKEYFINRNESNSLLLGILAALTGPVKKFFRFFYNIKNDKYRKIIVCYYEDKLYMLVGIAGICIKKVSPRAYFILKKHFPDK